MPAKMNVPRTRSLKAILFLQNVLDTIPFVTSYPRDQKLGQLRKESRENVTHLIYKYILG